MKRKDLIGEVEEIGFVFIRHGDRPDWYQNPETKISHPVPRHGEIKDSLAKHILKMFKGSSA